jgi:hypothetical protein
LVFLVAISMPWIFIGVAAVAVPAIAMIGGYGISGGAPRWVRVLCLLVLLGCVPAWALTATAVGGPSMSLGTPHGAWGAVLSRSLLVTFSIAAGPSRRAPITEAMDRGPGGRDSRGRDPIRPVSGPG